MTPASSRRSSIDGDTIVNLATTDFHKTGREELKEDEISLSLSYITFSASWSPRYDLALNTVKYTGALDYGAELRNTTSETWKDCKIVLSTSQTSFSGLSETIPVLQPWHVRLQKGKSNEGALYSRKELSARRAEYGKATGAVSQKPRGEVFGYDGSSAPVVKVIIVVLDSLRAILTDHSMTAHHAIARCRMSSFKMQRHNSSLCLERTRVQCHRHLQLQCLHLEVHRMAT